LQATAVGEAADVVLTIGCGFKQHALMAPMRPAVTHIQVDIDAAELHKEQLAGVAILGDAKLVLRQFIDAARRLPQDRLASNAERQAALAALRERWDSLSRPLLTSDEAPLNPFRVTAELAKALDPDGSILLHDAGSVRGTTCMHYTATRPRSFIGFGVQSAMGWSIGAAIGAKTAAPEKLVATVIGEEAFAETALDIETSVRGATPVLIVVLNNRAFTDRDGGVSARLAAARFHGGVEICAVAQALGAKTYRVEQPAALPATLAQAIGEVRAGTTAVVEVLTRRVKTNLARG
jgi:thiamine pyrophosphate-dependent acetolactate synthase large subunit-like protein